MLPIIARIEEWRTQLLDTSKRNRLVSLKFGRTGGIDLVRPDAADLWHQLVVDESALVFPWRRELVDLPPEDLDPEEVEPTGDEPPADKPSARMSDVLALCLASPRLRHDHLLTTSTDKQLNARLKRLSLNAREAETELGINTLFAAFGLLRWYESEDSKEPILSPLLLVPVRIDRDTIESPWVLRPEEDEVRRNDTLAELMKADHHVSLPQVDELLDDPEDLSELFKQYAGAMADRVKHHRRWEVLTDSAALGIFHFQKLAMWEDLSRNAERIAAHPLCRAIAGDREAVPSTPRDLPKAEELDERVPPSDAVHILDADSSQQAAIEVVKRGANLVLDGPPGTGKSQTIANLIAEYLAAGRTVLFVSEKTAALDVVKQRLDDRRLGDFCLDLHSHRANKREVVTELGRCLTLPPQSYLDPAERLRELGVARARLNAYVRALHARREPLGLSAFDTHGELARMEGLGSRTRCPTPEPLRVDGGFLRRITDVLGRLPDCLEVIRNRDTHPWRGCRVPVYSLGLRDDLEYHVGRLARLAREAADVAAGLAPLGLAPDRPTRAAWLTAEADAERLLAGPIVLPAWVEDDPRSVAAAVIELEHATRQARDLVGKLPEFSREAVRSRGTASLDGLGELPEPPSVGIAELPQLGLREGAKQLRNVEALIRVAMERGDEAGRAAAEVAESLGIAAAGLGMNQLPKLAEIGRLVLRAGAVPAGWWPDADRTELLGVAAQAADQASAASQLRRELLRAFVPATLDDPDRPGFSSLPIVHLDRADAGSMRLMEVREWLALRRDGSARLADAAAAVAEVAGMLADLLGCSEPPHRIGQVRLLADAAHRAMGLAPIAPGMWGEDRRDEARRALAELERLTAIAVAEAADLGGRVTPEALAGTFDPVVAEALRHRPWFRRLLPGWGAVKTRLSSAFPAGLPPAKLLFTDLERLAERRETLSQSDRMVAAHRDCWSFASDGRPDRRGTEQALDRAAEAERLIPPTARFREVMAESGALLRAEVASAGQAVARAVHALESVHGRMIAAPPIKGYSTPPELDRARPGELASWAEEQSRLAERHLAALDELRAAMSPGSFDATSQSALVGWLDRFRQFTDRVGYVRQIARGYGERLALARAEGDVQELEAIADRLKCVDALTRAVKLPPALKQAMAPDGGLDRNRLEHGIIVLLSAIGELKAAGGRLREACEVVEWGDSATGLPRKTHSGLADCLNVRLEVIGRALAFANRLLPLLRDGTDVAWPALPGRAIALRELVVLQVRLDALLAPAKVKSPSEIAEAHDWSEEAGLAKSLLLFLDGWPRPIGPALARGLSDQGTRAQLQGLVARSRSTRLSGFDESWAYLTTEVFPSNEKISTGMLLDAAPLDTLATWLADRTRDIPEVQDWIRYREVEREAESTGVASVLNEVRRGEVRADEASSAYRVRFLRRWLDAVYEQTPELRRFETDTHERLAARFIELDRLAVDNAPERIRNVLLARPDRPSLLADAPPKASELGLLVGQVDKKRGHLPLRKLFAKLPTVLTRLKPCLMMSPLAVSTYLQSPNFVFDLVIFDEASQVRPHDAVSAIYRGRQLVVAGDQKQLPPTSFFEKTTEADGDEDIESLGDYESVLDVCRSLGLPQRRLRWHYRSRREGLIAFSNRFYYGGELVTFPSSRDVDGSAVRFEYVATGRFIDGVNAIEARRVAELVMDHFRDSPDESLGVIAFSQKQQLRILDELEALRKAHPELEDYFREGRPEPFFVKNLENVQGDERDVMILGVGYGPDDAGKVAMRFGPLNRQGGERRLNVAITRARERMTLVSSLRAGDIDLSRTKAEGARLLRAYFDFAESGPEALARALTDADRREYDSPFEREVAEELQRRGLLVHRQVGCGGFRIDLAIVDPDHRGRYLLGVECDGATYHSSATARDRDRLRQEVLASLGWHLCRVWSTDWLRNRQSQVQRVLAAVERARRHSPELRRIPSEPPEPAKVSSPKPPLRPKVPPHYKSIADVPEAEIRRSVTEVLVQAGSTDSKDLIRSVARRLGFERTGKNIERRISEILDGMVRSGQVDASPDDGDVRVAALSAEQRAR
jgi:very-short-patch-repair endonuclease